MGLGVLYRDPYVRYRCRSRVGMYQRHRICWGRHLFRSAYPIGHRGRSHSWAYHSVVYVLRCWGGLCVCVRELYVVILQSSCGWVAWVVCSGRGSIG